MPDLEWRMDIFNDMKYCAAPSSATAELVNRTVRPFRHSARVMLVPASS